MGELLHSQWQWHEHRREHEHQQQWRDHGLQVTELPAEWHAAFAAELAEHNFKVANAGRAAILLITPRPSFW